MHHTRRINLIKCILYNHWTVATHSHARKRAAIGERTLPDARHAVRDRHARERTATLERIRRDARHAVRDRHARQPAAVAERPFPDARHTVG